MTLAIIVPVYEDDQHLQQVLQRFKSWRECAARDGCQFRILVVDGAAQSATQQLVEAQGATYHAAPRGRGNQIAAGIAALDDSLSAADRITWYWIVHADSGLGIEHLQCLLGYISHALPVWGRFDVAIEGLPLISWFMNMRSRVTRICTGDQTLFVHADLLASIGGFPAQPLMEDIEVSRRLKHSCGNSFRAPHLGVVTSARRWRERGVVRTVFAMWWTRYRYWLGAEPAVLFRAYYRRSDDE